MAGDGMAVGVGTVVGALDGDTLHTEMAITPTTTVDEVHAPIMACIQQEDIAEEMLSQIQIITEEMSTLVMQ
jgi:hypothetical protein